MNEPPDHTAELSDANLLSFAGMSVEKYSLTMSSCSRSPVHVEEQHALLLQALLKLVVDDLGLVLRADPGQVLLLRLRDPSQSQVSLMSAGRSSHEFACFSVGRM